MSEYSYTFNKDDLYTGQCVSIDEALAEARQEAEFYPEGDSRASFTSANMRRLSPWLKRRGSLRCCNVMRMTLRVMRRGDGWKISRRQRSNR